MNSEGSSGRPLLVALLAICAGLTFVIPIDFVALSPMWRAVSTGSLIVGFAVALLLIFSSSSTVVKAVASGALALVLLNQILLFNPVALLTVVGPLVIGMSAGYFLENRFSVMVWASVANAVFLLLDSLYHKHVVSYFFGTPFLQTSAELVFRARGFIGQPVPSSMIGVALCFGVMAHRTTSAGQTASKYLVLGSTLMTLVLTGTRSAALLAILGIVLLLVFFPLRRNTRISPAMSIIGPCALAALVVGSSRIIESSSNLRIVSFETLSGSSSLDNRAYALDVLGYWSDNCSGVCVLAGSGARSLLHELSQGLGVLGFTTVDNLYVSVLWDFGVLGLVALLAILALAFWRLGSKDDSRLASAGSLIVILTLVSGFSYDSLYTRSSMVLFGFGIGLIAAGVALEKTAGSTPFERRTKKSDDQDSLLREPITQVGR